MKKVSKKIVVGVAALVISIAVATGSTFAWFTTNRDADIDTFEATATTGETNLSIAANVSGDYNRDKVAFRRYVNLTEVPVQGDTKATVNKNVLDNKAEGQTTGGSILSALTMQNGVLVPMNVDYSNTVSYGSAVNYDTKVDETGVVNADSDKNVYHPYIEFVLHFKGDRAMSVYLTSSKVDPSSTNNTKPVQAVEYKAGGTYDNDTEIGIGDQILTRAAYAVRIAFIPVTGSWKADNTLDGSATLEADNSKIKVWCPNEAKFTGAEATTDETGLANGLWKANFAKDYYNAFMRTTKNYTAVGYSNYLCNLDKDSTTEKTNAKLCDLTADAQGNFVQTFVVRIWLEGTDGDCLNTILKDKLDISMLFTNDITHTTVTPSAS